MQYRKIILIGSWSPPAGGVASYMEDLYHNLKKIRNFRVKVFGIGWGQHNKHNRDIQMLTKANGSFSLWSFLKLFLSISNNTIIHTNSIYTSYPPNILFRLLLKYIQLRHAILIETLHDQTLIKRFSTLPLKDQKALMDCWKIAKFIVAINPNLEFFLKNLGIEESKIYITSPLLPFDVNPRPLIAVDRFRSRHNPIISTTGAFNSFYGIETIIQAFCLIKKSYPKSGLILVKCGFAPDSKCEARIKFLLKKNRCKNDVLVLEDIPHENFLYVLKISNVFIRGAKEESFGLSKVESLIMGTPVISTSTGQVQFMSSYSYGDIEDLNNKVISVLNNKENRTIKEAKDFYQQMASDNLSKIKQLYEKFI